MFAQSDFLQRSVFTGCAVTLAMVLAACSTPQVRHDEDSKVNIANYHSYTWEQVSDASPVGGKAFDNPLNQKRLRTAVDANLAKQNLLPVAAGAAPDAYVTVAVGTRQNIEVEDRIPVRFGLGFGFGGWRSGGFGSLAWGNDRLYDYTEGRVAIDLYDAKTREPIWHAAAEQDLSYLTGKNAEARINAVVEAMFKKFPGVVAAAK